MPIISLIVYTFASAAAAIECDSQASLRALTDTIASSSEQLPDSLFIVAAETTAEWGLPKDAAALMSKIRDSETNDRCARRISKWLARRSEIKSLRAIDGELDRLNLHDIIHASLVEALATTGSSGSADRELKHISDDYLRAEACLTAAQCARRNGHLANARELTEHGRDLVERIIKLERRQSTEEPPSNKVTTDNSLSREACSLLSTLAVELHACGNEVESKLAIDQIDWKYYRCLAVEQIAEIDVIKGDWGKILSRAIDEQREIGCTGIGPVILEALLRADRLDDARRCAEQLGNEDLIAAVMREQVKRKSAGEILDFVRKVRRKDVAALLIAECGVSQTERRKDTDVLKTVEMAGQTLDSWISEHPVTSEEIQAACNIAVIWNTISSRQRCEEVLQRALKRTGQFPKHFDPVQFQGGSRIREFLRIAEVAQRCNQPAISDEAFELAWEVANDRFALQQYCAAALGRSGKVMLLNRLSKAMAEESMRGQLLHICFLEAVRSADAQHQIEIANKVSQIQPELSRRFAELGVIRGQNVIPELIYSTMRIP